MKKPALIEAIISATILVILVSVAYVFSPSGPSDSEISIQKTRLLNAQVNLGRTRTIPDLPDIPTAWQQVNLEMSHCGIEVVKTPQPPADDISRVGQPDFWLGTITAKSIGISLTCFYSLVQRYPIKLVSINLGSEGLNARYKLYGIIKPTTINDGPKP